MLDEKILMNIMISKFDSINRSVSILISGWDKYNVSSNNFAQIFLFNALKDSYSECKKRCYL